ncbi:MAG: hypothetical protein Kow0080_35580 [Candidatus Promineifilaceae bacterium]
MENATTEELTSYLDQLTDADNRQEQSGQWDNCIPMQGGIMNCAPEGDWPEYYPLPKGRWYVKIGVGPIAYDSRQKIEAGLSSTVCIGPCVGIEGDLEFALYENGEVEFDLKYVKGIGIGTDFQVKGVNKLGILVMAGGSQSLNGKKEGFIRATAVDVSFEIGYEHK